MPGELSTFGANAALDAATGRATQTARTTYLMLLTAAPTDASTLTTAAAQEPFTAGTSGYARQPVTWSAPSGDPSATSNTTTLTFGPFTGDPANITHCALASALTGTTGDFIMWWALTVAKDAATNESIQFTTGNLSMTLD